MKDYTDNVVYYTDVSIEHTTCIGMVMPNGSEWFYHIISDDECGTFYVSSEVVLDSIEPCIDIQDVSRLTGKDLSLTDFTDIRQKMSFNEAVYSYYGSQASTYAVLTEKQFYAWAKNIKAIK